MSQSDTKKVYKAIDETDISNKVNKIVDQLLIQEGARNIVNDIIKEIKEDYGLSPSVVRATASIIYKSNKEEIEEKNGQVEELLTFCR
jgi:polyhydroxyalkanoate synthesis regulator phasin|tara:strand:- start:4293 stop:4556 length:264 start_codon:yes stop_codon:yes gene_type:complete